MFDVGAVAGPLGSGVLPGQLVAGMLLLAGLAVVGGCVQTGRGDGTARSAGTEPGLMRSG